MIYIIVMLIYVRYLKVFISPFIFAACFCSLHKYPQLVCILWEIFLFQTATAHSLHQFAVSGYVSPSTPVIVDWSTPPTNTKYWFPVLLQVTKV